MTDKLKKEEHRNYGVWLKCFIKAMKESLRTGLRFHPRDDDVAMLQQIKELTQKLEVTEEFVEKYYQIFLYMPMHEREEGLPIVIKRMLIEIGAKVVKNGRKKDKL